MPDTLSPPATNAHRRDVRGFTLLELVSTCTIIGVLMAMAIPPLTAVMDETRIVKAIREIQAVSIDLMTVQAGMDSLPDNLAGIGRSGMLDPWGRAYVYVNYEGVNAKHPAGARKDKFYKPLNADFDLYSKGADGKSVLNLDAAVSADDIIRALDGGFVGLARKF